MKLRLEDVKPHFGIKIATVEAITHGVVKVEFRDGSDGVIDLRPMIERGRLCAFLRDDREAFADVRTDEHGHMIFWLDPEGNEYEFGADQMKAWAVKQAALLQIAS